MEQYVLNTMGKQNFVHLVCDLKFVGALKFNLVAPMTEQLKPPQLLLSTPYGGSSSHALVYIALFARSTHVRPLMFTHYLIVVVPTCSGMCATKLKFWVLRLKTIHISIRHLHRIIRHEVPGGKCL